MVLSGQPLVGQVGGIGRLGVLGWFVLYHQGLRAAKRLMNRMMEWISDELKDALAQLSSRQARSIIRIVTAELAGRSLTSLLKGPDKICSIPTYYGQRVGGGWKNSESFQKALELARRDIRAWVLKHSANEALVLLAQAAPEAVRALQQQIMGDPRALAILEEGLRDPDKATRLAAAELLGQTELLAATPILNAALEGEEDEDVRRAIFMALGRIAGSTRSDRRAAATAVLNRAAVQTADKQVQITGEMTSDFDKIEDEEYERILEYCYRSAQAAGRGPTE